MKYTNINVCMYTPFFFPVLGGAEYSTHYISQELSKFCKVKIYTFNWINTSDDKKTYGINLSSGLLKVENINDVAIFRYPTIEFPFLRNISWKLTKDIENSGCDIVHFQGLSRLFSRYLIQNTIKNKITILTTHALQEAIEIVNNHKLKFFINKFFINSLNKMDHIIAISKTDVNSLINLGISSNKITYIPNGINESKFQKRNKYIERNNNLKILCVARFDKNKKYENLIYAINNLVKDFPNLEAYFVGMISDSLYYERIIRLIKKYNLEEKIKIGVSLDEPSLIDCYLECDLFVLPSSMETFPLVILEAMYAGLPIVATSVGGIPDIIKDGFNGFLVPPNDPRQLYERCFEILKNDELRISFGKKNKEIVKNYTWKKVAFSTYRLYQSLFNEREKRK